MFPTSDNESPNAINSVIAPGAGFAANANTTSHAVRNWALIPNSSVSKIMHIILATVSSKYANFSDNRGDMPYRPVL